jgi:hypothetical protein
MTRVKRVDSHRRFRPGAGGALQEIRQYRERRPHASLFSRLSRDMIRELMPASLWMTPPAMLLLQEIAEAWSISYVQGLILAQDRQLARRIRGPLPREIGRG